MNVISIELYSYVFVLVINVGIRLRGIQPYFGDNDNSNNN